MRTRRTELPRIRCNFITACSTPYPKITLKHKEYTINDIRSGLLLLKVIIQASSIDSNATTSAVRMALASLDEYMPTVKDDISKFNAYVLTQVELLKARGHDTQDLTVNLFKAYGTVKDAKFREYIALKESEYEENSEEIPYEKLMLLAENKYKIRKVRQTWNERTPEEEKIIALEAYIKKLGKPKPPSKDPKKTPKDPRKKTPKDKGGREPEPWMLVAPKDGEPKEKSVENKTWHWCPKHAKWTRHKPEDCKGIGGNSEKKKGKESEKDKRLRLARAVTALAQESEEE